MSTEKERAIAATMAPSNEQHNEVYRNCARRSSSKLRNLRNQIGELLLYLQTAPSQSQQQEYWTLFEAKLRQYVALKLCGGTT